jgi:hypothetical protein
MLARFRLTDGQASDSPEALPLLDELKPASLAADKGYDSNAILRPLESTGSQVVIPSRPIALNNARWTNMSTPREIWSNVSSATSGNSVISPPGTTNPRTPSRHSSASPPHSSGSANFQRDTESSLSQIKLENSVIICQIINLIPY